MKHIHEIWAFLHDGVVSEIEGTPPGDMSIRVQIEFLRDEIPNMVDSLIVNLRKCEIFHFTDRFKKNVKTNVNDIQALQLEILGAGGAGDAVTVVCEQGWLFLKYDSAFVTVDSGRAISLGEMDDALGRYVAGLKGDRK